MGKRNVRRGRVSVLMVLVVATLQGLPSRASGSAAPSPELDCVLPGDSMCERWTAAQHGTQYDSVRAIGADRAGKRVFLTGIEWPSPYPGNNIVTFAFDAAGTLLWKDSYNGPRGIQDIPSVVAVSPDGLTAVVAGVSDDNGLSANPATSDYVAVGYDAATGTRKWVATYDSGAYDFGMDAVFAPDGSTFYMTGISRGSGDSSLDFDHVTVAFDAVTGKLLWTAREGAPGEGYDYGIALAVSPDGRFVASTGWWQKTAQELGYGTHVFDADSGDRRWRAVLGAGPQTSSAGRDLEFSPDSRLLHVTGTLATEPNEPKWDAGTATYRVDDGALLWTDRLAICSSCGTPSLALSGQRGTVHVVGTVSRTSVTGAVSYDFAVASIDPSTGDRGWTAYYDDGLGLNQMSPGITVAPDGRYLYVAGTTQDSQTNQLTTVALNATTGAVAWDARYGVPTTVSNVSSSAPDIAAGGGLVFVGKATIERIPSSQADFFVAAYEQAPSP